MTSSIETSSPPPTDGKAPTSKSVPRQPRQDISPSSWEASASLRNAKSKSASMTPQPHTAVRAGGSVSSKGLPPAPDPSVIFRMGKDHNIRVKFLLQGTFGAVEYRDLQVAVRKHGGEIESRMGKADIMVADVNVASEAVKLRREAKKMGSPIPIVLPRYIDDCIEAGRLLDWSVSLYSPDDQLKLQLTASTPKAGLKLSGRNPFTDEDKAYIVEYLGPRAEPWNLNGAARDFAIDRPSHTKYSWLSFLQDNMTTKWNIKQHVAKWRAEPGRAPLKRSLPLVAIEADGNGGTSSVQSQPDAAKGAETATTTTTAAAVAAGTADTSPGADGHLKERLKEEKAVQRNVLISSDPVDEESEPVDGWGGPKCQAGSQGENGHAEDTSATLQQKAVMDLPLRDQVAEVAAEAEAGPADTAAAAPAEETDPAVDGQDAAEQRRGRDGEYSSSAEVEDELDVRPPRPGKALQSHRNHQEADQAPVVSKQPSVQIPPPSQNPKAHGTGAGAGDDGPGDRSSSFEEAVVSEESEPEDGWQMPQSLINELETPEKTKEAEAATSRKTRQRRSTSGSSDDEDSRVGQGDEDLESDAAVESEVESEMDELADPDADVEASAAMSPRQAAEPKSTVAAGVATAMDLKNERRHRGQDADADYEPHWRAVEREKGPPRKKFTEEDKTLLARRLSDLYGSGTDDDLLEKPPLEFWERLHHESPRHSAPSWLSHFNKNSHIYMEAVQVARTADQDTQMFAGDEDADDLTGTQQAEGGQDGSGEQKADEAQEPEPEPEQGQGDRQEEGPAVAAEPAMTVEHGQDLRQEREADAEAEVEEGGEAGADEQQQQQQDEGRYGAQREQEDQAEAATDDDRSSNSSEIDIEAWIEMEKDIAAELAEADADLDESAGSMAPQAESDSRSAQLSPAASSRDRITSNAEGSASVSPSFRPSFVGSGAKVEVVIPSHSQQQQQQQLNGRTNDRAQLMRATQHAEELAQSVRRTDPAKDADEVLAEQSAGDSAEATGAAQAEAMEAVACETPDGASRGGQASAPAEEQGQVPLVTPTVDQRREHHEAKVAAKEGDPNARESNQAALVSPTLSVAIAAAAVGASPPKALAAATDPSHPHIHATVGTLADVDLDEAIGDVFDLGEADVPVLHPASPPEQRYFEPFGMQPALMLSASQKQAEVAGSPAEEQETNTSAPVPPLSAETEIGLSDDDSSNVVFQSFQQASEPAASPDKQQAPDSVRAVVTETIARVEGASRQSAARQASNSLDGGSGGPRLASRTSREPCKAGIPLLDRHRNATFHDFTMDSDEEDRVRASTARRAPPPPPAARSSAPFAHSTPTVPDYHSRSMLETRAIRERSANLSDAQRRRVEEWASRTSAELEAEAEAEADGNVRLQAASRSVPAKRLQTAALSPRRFVDPERRSTTVALASTSAFGSPAQQQRRRRQARESVPSAVASGERSEHDALEAKRRYTESVKKLCSDFGLSTPAQAVPFMMPNGWNVARAREALSDKVAKLAAAYDVTPHDVVEFVRTAEGKWDEAEKYLRVLAKSPSKSRWLDRERAVGELAGGDDGDDGDDGNYDGDNGPEEEEVVEEAAAWQDDGSQNLDRDFHDAPPLRKRQRSALDSFDPSTPRRKQRRYTALVDEGDELRRDQEGAMLRTGERRRSRHTIVTSAPNTRSRPTAAQRDGQGSRRRLPLASASVARSASVRSTLGGRTPDETTPGRKLGPGRRAQLYEDDQDYYYDDDDGVGHYYDEERPASSTMRRRHASAASATRRIYDTMQRQIAGYEDAHAIDDDEGEGGGEGEEHGAGRYTQLSPPLRSPQRRSHSSRSLEEAKLRRALQHAREMRAAALAAEMEAEASKAAQRKRRRGSSRREEWVPEDDDGEDVDEEEEDEDEEEVEYY